MPAADLAESPSPASRIDYPRVWLLSLGHFSNDMYGNLLNSLTPYLVIRGEITTTTAGIVLLVYLVGSSFLQPLFGVVSDRSGRRVFAVYGPLSVGIAASLIGWASNNVLLLLLAGLGGIGTAGFHPQAAAMIDRLSNRRKGWVMAIFSMGGNIGFSVGPLLAAGIATVGLHFSPLAIIPGIIVVVLLALYTPTARPERHEFHPAPIKKIIVEAWRRLTLIILIIAARSGLQYGMVILLPLYEHARGSSAQLGSTYAFALSFSGAIGGLIGGGLSDRYGRRFVVVGTLLLAFPLFLAAVTVTGWLVLPLMAFGGAALLASNSVTVVQGQEMLPANTGVAGGLTMGVGFGLSGVLASGLAATSDHIGVEHAILLVPFLALCAAILGWFIPDRSPPVMGAARPTLVQ